MKSGSAPPLALTEFDVRTAGDYDATTATLDSPTDFSQLGVNAIIYGLTH